MTVKVNGNKNSTPQYSCIIIIIIIIIIITIIIIISIYKASISLTVLGALQYHKKCYSIKTTSISKKIRYKSINQGKVW